MPDEKTNWHAIFRPRGNLLAGLQRRVGAVLDLPKRHLQDVRPRVHRAWHFGVVGRLGFDGDDFARSFEET